MAVIRFTAADVLQTKVVEANLYPSEITKIEGPTASSSGKSVNFIVDIMITEGKYKGKTRTVMFSSGVSNPTVLGAMQFFPQQTFIEIDSAITGKEHEPGEFSFDTESLVHKPFEASWGIATVDGHLTNTINGFHPKGYSTKPVAF